MSFDRVALRSDAVSDGLIVTLSNSIFRLGIASVTRVGRKAGEGTSEAKYPSYASSRNLVVF